MKKLEVNKIILLWICYIFCMGIHTVSSSSVDCQSQKLKKCLIDCWGTDVHTAHYICEKYHSYWEQDVHLMEEFIELSQEMVIDFTTVKELPTLHELDGIYQAPDAHKVIFESPYVRILEGVSQPHKSEALHIHVWPGVVLNFTASKYKIEYADGTVKIKEYSKGVSKVSGGSCCACTNIGTAADECLRFEIKE